MKRLRSLLILVAFALMPLLAFATNEGGEKSEGLDIPKVVLEHLNLSSLTNPTMARFTRRCLTAQRNVRSI